MVRDDDERSCRPLMSLPTFFDRKRPSSRYVLRNGPKMAFGFADDVRNDTTEAAWRTRMSLNYSKTTVTYPKLSLSMICESLKGRKDACFE